jgi:ERCC4-related helicase
MASFVQHPLITPDKVEQRLYQEVITARVLEKGNSLIVAPTGLGKTAIGLMVAAKLLEKNPGKKIIFLAPTRPLALQHQKSFSSLLQLEEKQIILLDGQVKPADRKKAWKHATVICATPQTIENDLITRTVSMEDCCLCIFDEAHRAVGNYAYVYIAQQLQRQAQNATTLALTASPGATQEKIQAVCQNLFIENIEIKTPQDSDVAPYTKETTVEWKSTHLPPQFLEIRKYLDDFMKEQLVALKKVGVAHSTNIKYYNKVRLLEMQSRVRKQLMAKGNTQPYLFQAISRCAMLMKSSHATMLLETQGINAAFDYFERMKKKAGQAGASKALKTMIVDDNITYAYNLTGQLKEKGVDHPKKVLLQDTLQKQLAHKPDSKIIVFNHYRDSIKSIVSYLNDFPEFTAHRFVGQAAKENEKGLSQKEQADIIDQFRNKKFNILVASSVAEEGLDIPAVDLVVFFEPVPSEIRTIQRRGRTGRMEEGKVVILMAKNTRDEAFYWSSRAKEKTMHKTLHAMKGDLGKNVLPKKKALDQQATLHSFSEDAKENVLIYADTREQASSVVKELTQHDAFVKVKQLDVGDYVLSDDICVERKTMQDFLESMVDGRLFQQLVSLSSNYSSPLILLEGEREDLFTMRNIHKNAIRGAMSSIATTYRIPILYTRDAKETAEYLFLIAKREQLGKDKDIKLRVGRKGLTQEEQQQFIVESLPLVGPNMAKKLLAQFGSVEGVFTASEKELLAVEGMGKVKAKKIRKISSVKFNKK